MTDTYSSAFEGYERYFDELHNLEAQPNEKLLPIAAERIENITSWFHERIKNTDVGENPGKRSYAFPVLCISIGAPYIYTGIKEGNLFDLGIGAVNFFGGLSILKDVYQHNHAKEEEKIEQLTPEQKRYMYAKFLLQSIEAKIPQKS